MRKLCDFGTFFIEGKKKSSILLGLGSSALVAITLGIGGVQSACVIVAVPGDLAGENPATKRHV